MHAEAEMLQYLNDVRCTGSSCRFLSPFVSRVYLCAALPLIKPVRRSSNPFCLLSPNKTGYTYYKPAATPNPKASPSLVAPGLLLKPKQIRCPNPWGKHKIGGTDPTPPVFPKGV